MCLYNLLHLLYDRRERLKGMRMMQKVYFYTKTTCPTCDEALALLEMFESDYAFEIVERDIYSNDTWLEQYHLTIPVIEIGDTTLQSPKIDIATVEDVLRKHCRSRGWSC